MKLFKRERGAAAVEFAIIIPVLIMLIFGMIEFGRAYNAKVTLTHAAREAVRDYTIHNDIGQAVTVGLDASQNLGGAVVTITDPCTNVANDTATVTATWDLDYTIPLVNSGTVNLSEDAVMRCGG